MYLSDGGKKRSTDFTLHYWRSIIQVFVFNILSPFDMFVIFLFIFLNGLVVLGF